MPRGEYSTHRPPPGASGVTSRPRPARTLRFWSRPQLGDRDATRRFHRLDVPGPPRMSASRGGPSVSALRIGNRSTSIGPVSRSRTAPGFAPRCSMWLALASATRFGSPYICIYTYICVRSPVLAATLASVAPGKRRTPARCGPRPIVGRRRIRFRSAEESELRVNAYETTWLTDAVLGAHLRAWEMVQNSPIRCTGATSRADGPFTGWRPPQNEATDGGTPQQ